MKFLEAKELICKMFAQPDYFVSIHFEVTISRDGSETIFIRVHIIPDKNNSATSFIGTTWQEVISKMEIFKNPGVPDISEAPDEQ